MGYVIEHKDFGKIVLTLRANQRSIRLRVTQKGMNLSAPIGITKKEIERFLIENADAIQKLKQRQEERCKELFFSPTQDVKFLTFRVEIRETEGRKSVAYLLKDGILHIFYPAKYDLNRLQESFFFIIKKCLRQEAKRVLPEKVAQLAKEWGFQYKSVKIQSSKTRWGSCSSTKNINLSFYLLQLPECFVDFVILHELCHTREMNHGPRFWEELDRVTGGKAKDLSRKLKACKRLLPD